MIRLRDAWLLSTTKLKTRRVRLVVTTLVSGLFFVILALASIVFNGSTKSIDSFSEEGFGNRYMASLSNFSSIDYEVYNDPTVIAESKNADKKLVADKKAEAKKMGIDYDPALEILSVLASGGTQGQEVATPSPQNAAIVNQIKQESYKPFFEAVEKVRQPYNIIATYYGVSLNSMSPFGQTGTQLSVLKDGKEKRLSDPVNGFGIPVGFDSITSGINVMSDEVLEPFLVTSKEALKSTDAIPIVAPFSAAEEALGFKKLPANASKNDRLNRLQEVRAKAAGVRFEVCLRNATSTERQQTAQQQQQEIEQNKNTRGYVKPELVYTFANEPCKDVVVQRDVRSAEAKKLAEKQKQFDEKFGKQPSEQRVTSFKIVGLSPDASEYASGFSVRSLVSSLLTSSLGGSWYVPLSAKDMLPEYKDAINNIGKLAGYEYRTVVEFANVDDAKRFVKEKSCTPSYTEPVESLQDYCDSKDTPFIVSSFGSNSVAINDAQEWFERFFYRASLVIAGVSAFIMMGTVGKVIADSRRETAVFRAIGAKRLDISLVYVLYSLQIGLIIVLFSFVAAFGIAFWMDQQYSSTLTIDALTAYSATNLDREVSLVGIDVSQLLMIGSVILGASFLAAIFPLFNNLKRNPIRDMRDER